jgi:CubicO group peptidase (beta-lactamase class C family)
MSHNTKRNCVKVSLIAVFLLLLQTIQAQYNFTELDQKLVTLKKELGSNFSLLVYRDGKIIYDKSIGEFTPKTQVPIASSSKWLTAALVMVLVDEGKLSLDDKVSKFLPIFNKYSKGYITIRQCLSHLTGIESEPIKLSNLIKRNKYNSLEEEVEEFATKKEIIANPGLEFRYSNIGLNIAGRIIEIVSRRGFEQVMQEKILRPLQMRNTSFSSFNAVNPSGGAVSTANDYMNFLVMILNKGMYNGKRILSEASIELMQTAQTTSPMIKYTPNDNELGRKLREWYFQLQNINNKKKYINPYNGKIEEH